MVAVTHLSYRTSGGGAARSASRVHQTMLHRGVDSRLLALVDDFANNRSERDLLARRVFTAKPSMRAFNRVVRAGKRFLYSRQDRSELIPNATCSVFTSDRSPLGADLVNDLGDPNIIHMHWVAEMFDERMFLPSATRIAPVVWSMRDMRPFTGGCHYDLGCGKFQTGCGNCPQLRYKGDSDLSARIWARREKTFSTIDRSRLAFVAPSQWLADEFNTSPLSNRFPVHVIPNGVDTEVFRPRVDNRNGIREVDPDALVIIFNAASLDNQIKGSSLLCSALNEVAACYSGKKLQLLTVGAGSIDTPLDIPVVSAGHLQSDEELSAAYQSADLFVIPSLQDNCPNTVLEAFACGVPVVGFDSSGIPDLVIPGDTGLLARPFDPRDLASQIMTVLSDEPTRRLMSLNCRRYAVERYSQEAETTRYLQLYHQMLE